ncbi:hypothetical protein BCR33DRAFT_682469 [Rhizoclosmatium globosum]|uniref:Ubiquitin-domain-containing protein n=1 Tax=Rhizoclosmatium globosum TaxID=329046 RepID=A0A1Y2BUH0_9FUNG|nr:hypothetical protein BCR33DRAFT_682469 [Rhizoclosmatium globosum]|eukprot:ORY38401.1 hypothetical protein BCR33DRAFT_682469 [Rhizoclosmatium globosum]
MLTVSHNPTSLPQHDIVVMDLSSKDILLMKTVDLTSRDTVESIQYSACGLLASIPGTWSLRKLSFLSVPDLDLKRNMNLSSLSTLAQTKGNSRWLAQVNKTTLPSNAIKLYIKNLTDRQIEVYCSADDTIENVCWRIQEHDGIPVEQMRLIFSGIQLEMGRMLSDYNITSETTIHLVLRLRGGGVAMGTGFVDVSSGGPESVEFSDKAPEWRLAGYGLNVEGVCENETCEAYQCQVISPQGFGVFDIQVDENKSRCPQCYGSVTPAECGFYDCEYRFAGMKFDAVTNQITKFSSDWAVARKKDNYVYFSASNNGVATWGTLVIQTRVVQSGGANIPECGICLYPLSSEERKQMVKCTECQTEFHRGCGCNWEEAVDEKCPVCESVQLFEGFSVVV